MKPFEVVSIGLATADTIVSLPAWPDPDGRVVTDPIHRSFGGPAATAAVTLARLGHRAAMVGATGDDEAGTRVRADLAAAGVDVTQLRTLSGATPESVILLDRGAHTRAIIHAPGAVLDALPVEALALCAEARWVHVDQAGYQLIGELDRARSSVDAGHPIEGLVLAGLGLYAPSATALSDRYPGRGVEAAVAAALAEGALRVAVTLGADGAIAADASGAWRVAAPPGEIVSTLGAGDVFHGALLASLLNGLPLPDAMRRAVVAATLSCRAIDGRGDIPGREELEAALHNAPSPHSIDLEAAR